MKKDEPIQDVKPEGEGSMSEAEIDRNLQDTFPASDPPSWTLGTNHHEEVTPESEKDDERDEPPRH
jgi:hypothetical protein